MDNLLDELEFVIIASDNVCRCFDNITYTIFFANRSGRELNNIFIEINVPKNTKFIDDSLYINGKKSDIYYKSGIKIKKLPKDSILIFSYKVKVDSIPKEFYIENAINLYFVREENKKICYEKNMCSNKVITKVEKEIIKEDIELRKNENINILCSLKSKNNVLIEEEENVYYGVIYNKGARSFRKCKIEISNLEDIEIKDISLIKDCENKVLDKNAKEIEVDEIEPNEKVTIKFLACARKNIKKEINIRFKIKGKVEIEELNREVIREFYSNNCIVKLEKANVKVFFKSNKECLVKNEKIIYKTTIINEGTIPIVITYYMNISKGLKLIKNDISINGKVYKSKGGEIECIECCIDVGEGIEIDIPCKYIRSYGKNKVFAEGVVRYEYFLEESNVKGIRELKTEKIYTEATISTFKEILIEKTVELEYISSKKLNISNLYVEPSINDYYIMSMNRGLSYNEYNLKEEVIMVSGNLKIIIEYTDEENISEMKILFTESNFSTFLELPEDYTMGELENVNAELQGVYYKLIENKELLINISLLINTTL